MTLVGTCLLSYLVASLWWIQCACIEEAIEFDPVSTNIDNLHRFLSSYSGNSTASIRLPPSILQKSIVNYGQMNANVRHKLASNQCLDFIAFGTSVTCCESETDTLTRPKTFDDGWTYQLLKQLHAAWPPCYRGSVLSNHSFVQVRCYGHRFNSDTVTYTEKVYEREGIQESWLESVQIERRKPISKLLKADIIFVETLVDMYQSSEKPTEAFLYSLLTLPSKPSLIYVGATFQVPRDHRHIWSNFDVDESNERARYDSVPYILPTVQHYGVPFISAVDALGPFVTDESKKWVSGEYITDGKAHLSRTGMKIFATLVSQYLIDVRNSLVHSFSGFEAVADTYVEVEKITPLHWKPEQLKDLVTDAHPPLTITLNDQLQNRYIWMTDESASKNWLLDDRLSDSLSTHSLTCSQIGESFSVLVPYDSVRLHFFHQKIRIKLGKNIADMGTLHIEIRIFGQTEVLTELTVDCLISAKTDRRKLLNESGTLDSTSDRYLVTKDERVEINSESNAESRKGPTQRELQVVGGAVSPEEIKLLQTLVWIDENIHIAKKLAPTDSLEIKFTVVASEPARVVNTVKLATIHLS